MTYDQLIIATFSISLVLLILVIWILVVVLKMVKKDKADLRKFCSDTQGTKIKIPKYLKLN